MYSVAPLRLLIVDDDPMVAGVMARNLEGLKEPAVIDVAGHAGEGLRLFRDRAYDLVLLDLGLPDRSGLSLLPDLRAIRHEVPILVITGSGDDKDVVAGLDAGADDYITKPVSADVLRARVSAALRRRTPPEPSERSPKPEEPLIIIGDLTLDVLARRVRTSAGDVALTPTELRLLAYLMEHVGEVVTRPAILKEVWGYDFDPGTSLLDVTLARVRSKLAAATHEVQIQTLRAQGLMLKRT